MDLREIDSKIKGYSASTRNSGIIHRKNTGNLFVWYDKNYPTFDFFYEDGYVLLQGMEYYIEKGKGRVEKNSKTYLYCDVLSAQEGQLKLTKSVRKNIASTYIAIIFSDEFGIYDIVDTRWFVDNFDRLFKGHTHDGLNSLRVLYEDIAFAHIHIIDEIPTLIDETETDFIYATEKEFEDGSVEIYINGIKLIDFRIENKLIIIDKKYVSYNDTISVNYIHLINTDLTQQQYILDVCAIPEKTTEDTTDELAEEELYEIEEMKRRLREMGYTDEEIERMMRERLGYDKVFTEEEWNEGFSLLWKYGLPEHIIEMILKFRKQTMEKIDLGITEFEIIEELRKYGYTDEEIERYMKYARYKSLSEIIEELRKYGYTDEEIEEYIRNARHIPLAPLLFTSQSKGRSIFSERPIYSFTTMGSVTTQDDIVDYIQIGYENGKKNVYLVFNPHLISVVPYSTANIFTPKLNGVWYEKEVKIKIPSIHTFYHFLTIQNTNDEMIYVLLGRWYNRTIFYATTSNPDRFFYSWEDENIPGMLRKREIGKVEEMDFSIGIYRQGRRCVELTLPDNNTWLFEDVKSVKLLDGYGCNTFYRIPSGTFPKYVIKVIEIVKPTLDCFSGFFTFDYHFPNNSCNVVGEVIVISGKLDGELISGRIRIQKGYIIGSLIRINRREIEADTKIFIELGYDISRGMNIVNRILTIYEGNWQDMNFNAEEGEAKNGIIDVIDGDIYGDINLRPKALGDFFGKEIFDDTVEGENIIKIRDRKLVKDEHSKTGHWEISGSFTFDKYFLSKFHIHYDYNSAKFSEIEFVDVPIRFHGHLGLYIPREKEEKEMKIMKIETKVRTGDFVIYKTKIDI